MHIVFLELIIDPACSIIFEAEKEEKNVMSRPPKDINEPFFGINKILLGCFQGIGILVVTLLVYFLGNQNRSLRKSNQSFNLCDPYCLQYCYNYIKPLMDLQLL